MTASFSVSITAAGIAIAALTLDPGSAGTLSWVTRAIGTIEAKPGGAGEFGWRSSASTAPCSAADTRIAEPPEGSAGRRIARFFALSFMQKPGAAAESLSSAAAELTSGMAFHDCEW